MDKPMSSLLYCPLFHPTEADFQSHDTLQFSYESFSNYITLHWYQKLSLYVMNIIDLIINKYKW